MLALRLADICVVAVTGPCKEAETLPHLPPPLPTPWRMYFLEGTSRSGGGWGPSYGLYMWVHELNGDSKVRVKPGLLGRLIVPHTRIQYPVLSQGSSWA